jgi:hypothetical protein
MQSDLPKLDRQAPLIGVPACVKQINDVPFHAVGEKYITAVVQGTGGLPLLLPALGPAYDIPALIGRMDGLLVTGSASNIATHHYGGRPDRPDSPQDPARDATTLPLILAALDAGLPLLCICRGLQELNVALGGTLHTQIHLVQGYGDHRSPREGTYEERYRVRHLAALAGERSPRRRPGGGSARAGRRDRGGRRQEQQGFRPRRAMAPGIQGPRRCCIARHLRRVRRCRARLVRAAQSPCRTGRLTLP